MSNRNTDVLESIILDLSIENKTLKNEAVQREIDKDRYWLWYTQERDKVNAKIADIDALEKLIKKFKKDIKSYKEDVESKDAIVEFKDVTIRNLQNLIDSLNDTNHD